MSGNLSIKTHTKGLSARTGTGTGKRRSPHRPIHRSIRVRIGLPAAREAAALFE
jgi:hypothetical protein